MDWNDNFVIFSNNLGILTNICDPNFVKNWLSKKICLTVKSAISTGEKTHHVLLSLDFNWF